jgi:hypothetical protein
MIELFDHWDPPGPSNDTEFAVFGLILTFCLILLVSRLIALLDRLIEFITLFHVPPCRTVCSSQRFCFSGLVVPHGSPPLRI